MARAFIWVMFCIICASTAVSTFADPLEEAPKATEGQAGNANFDSEKFAGDAADKFTKQLEQVFATAEARKTRCVPASNGSILNAEDFQKAVVCALSINVPHSQGKPGYATVRFVVLEGGALENLEIEQSSGDAGIDQIALMAVKQADMPDPPAGISLADRTFSIKYIVQK
jgi:periplasmic protein TonB